MASVPAQRSASFRAVFAVGEFRAVWLAELQSTAGDQLARVALSVLVFQRTGSAALTAVTYALTQLPDLVAGPLLSGLADRFPRRRVMVVCDVARAALLVVMAIPGLSIATLVAPLAVGAIAPLVGFAFRPELPLAMALLVVSGACGAYQTTASATFMREVPNSRRGQAFGLAGSGLIAVQGLGVAAGGVLAQAMGSAATAIAVAGMAGIPIGLLAAAAWQRSGWRNRSVAAR